MACTQGPSSLSHVARALAISSPFEARGRFICCRVSASPSPPIHPARPPTPLGTISSTVRSLFATRSVLVAGARRTKRVREGEISPHPAGLSGSRSPGRPSPHTTVQSPVRGDESDASVHIRYAHMVLPLWVSGPFSRVCVSSALRGAVLRGQLFPSRPGLISPLSRRLCAEGGPAAVLVSFTRWLARVQQEIGACECLVSVFFPAVWMG